MTLTEAIARQTGSSVAAPAWVVGSLTARPGARPGSCRMPACSGRRTPARRVADAWRPGGRRWRGSAGRPASPRSAANGALDVRDPLGIRGLGAFGRVGGIQWPAEGPREEPGHDAAIARVLVEPRVLAARRPPASRPGADRGRLRGRRGRPPRGAPCGSAARPCRPPRARAGPARRSGRSPSPR